MTPRWTPTLTERRQIRTFFAVGKSDAEIATLLGRTATQVARVRRELGLKRERHRFGPAPEPEWHPVALGMFRRHLPDAEIAVEVGRAVETVAAYRRSLGFRLPARRWPSNPAPEPPVVSPPRRCHPILERDLAVMAAAKRQGHGYNAIARLWRLKPWTVRRYLIPYLRQHPLPQQTACAV